MTGLLKARADAERTARELARSNDDLRQFAYAASHDLQEPLRTVIAYSQLLDRRHSGSMEEQARSYLAWIVGAGQRLDELLRNLRAYWAAGDGDDSPPVPVNSASALDKALANLQTAIERLPGARSWPEICRRSWRTRLVWSRCFRISLPMR